MKKKTSVAPSPSIREARAAYSAPMTVRAIYREGRFELNEPITSLGENQDVELIVRIEDSDDLQQRAIDLVQQAKLQAARDAQTMTSDEAWAEYDRAAAALRRALRRK